MENAYVHENAYNDFFTDFVKNSLSELLMGYKDSINFLNNWV